MPSVVKQEIEMNKKLRKSLIWLETARLAGKVDRLHATPTIQKYTVAEHVYNAMIIGIELCNMEGMDSERVIRAILIHDVEESYTGDVLGHIKVIPTIKAAMTEIEVAWSKDNIPNHHWKIQLTGKGRYIVKLADKLELAHFCLDELDMGNRSTPFIQVIVKVIGTLEAMIPEDNYLPNIASTINEMIAALQESIQSK